MICKFYLKKNSFSLFINTHTHKQLFDAKIELVNLNISASEKPNNYSYGIHPWQIDTNGYQLELKLLEQKAHEKKCLAIGECGLDKLSSVDFLLQQQVFVEQIKIANRIKKPLIIHCVKAFNELLNCLNLNNNEVPVLIHGFNNNENITRVLQSEGFYFSFGKALLGYDSNAAKAIKQVGRKNIFLETDDTDLSIKYVYKKAAELLGIDEDIIKEQLKHNFETVFKIKL